MSIGNVLDQVEGDVRFHHLTPELWVMEARQCAHRWVVFHENYSFCLVERVQHGALVDWKYNRRVYVADPRHAMLMQPGELHANVHRTPPGDFVVVQVSDRLMKSTAQRLGWSRSELNINHPHPGSDHPLLIQALRKWRGTLCSSLFAKQRGEGQCTCAEALALHLDHLTHLVAAFIETCADGARSSAGATDAGVRKAVAYLRRCYKEPYDLDRLARAAGCSPHYLVHRFSAEIGAPPSMFQTRLLAAETARTLVSSPRKPLQLIAHEVGWPGRSSAPTAARANVMIKHFRRTWGTTPDEFRNSVRKGTKQKSNRV